MSKKVDVSFMKFVYTDAEWTREIVEGGDKQLCSECTRTRRRNFFDSQSASRRRGAIGISRFLAHHLSPHLTTPHLVSLARAVVDVYSKIWGPCEMIAGHFSNFFFDLGETYGMKFVRAEADKVTALKEFKDVSRPLFIFYLNGEEKGRSDGPNIPAILDVITNNAPPAAA